MGKKDETADLNGLWYILAFLLIIASIFFFVFSYDDYGVAYVVENMLRAIFFAMLTGFSLLMGKK